MIRCLLSTANFSFRCYCGKINCGVWRDVNKSSTWRFNSCRNPVHVFLAASILLGLSCFWRRSEACVFRQFTLWLLTATWKLWQIAHLLKNLIVKSNDRRLWSITALQPIQQLTSNQCSPSISLYISFDCRVYLICSCTTGLLPAVSLPLVTFRRFSG